MVKSIFYIFLYVLILIIKWTLSNKKLHFKIKSFSTVWQYIQQVNISSEQLEKFWKLGNEYFLNSEILLKICVLVYTYILYTISSMNWEEMLQLHVHFIFQNKRAYWQVQTSPHSRNQPYFNRWNTHVGEVIGILAHSFLCLPGHCQHGAISW